MPRALRWKPVSQRRNPPPPMPPVSQFISPRRSFIWGGITSFIAAWVVGRIAYWAVPFFWDFSSWSDVLGYFIAVFLAICTAVLMFVLNLRETQLFELGVRKRFGALTGDVYTMGWHWKSPFDSILNVPDSNKNFVTRLEGERIDAQDGAPIYFGLEEQGGKPNRLQFSIVDQIKYAAMDDPMGEIRAAYLEMARLFFGQAAAAIGVKSCKSLFNEFLLLPPPPTRANDPDYDPYCDPQFRPGNVYAGFRRALQHAMFARREGGSERLFSDDAIKAMMAKAGSFKWMCTSWGIGNLLEFTPNVRENPETEAAAIKKQVAEEQARVTRTTATAVAAATAEIKLQGVSPDLAAVITAGINGQTVTIANESKTLTFPDAARVVETLGTLLINRLAPEQEGKS